MKEKVEKLLAEKKLAKKELLLEYDEETCPTHHIDLLYSQEYDKLEAEIELLKLLLLE